MVVCYVRFHNELDSAPRGKIYALILPHADGTCNEVARRTSEIAGIGLFPIGWETLAFPVAMAYLGVHTVVRDQRTSDIFVHVLRGDFARLTIGDAELLHGHGYVADDFFAVPQPLTAQQRLASSTKLLKVAACRHYLLEDEVQSALHFTGHHARHFEQLGNPCAKSLATVRRRANPTQFGLLT